VVPFRISFESKPYGTVYYIEEVMNFYFMTDILVNFNTGYYLKGDLIMSRIEANWAYFKTWFLLDLIASFPYEWVINTDNVDETSS
jgi:hyperpolarization activated cyclic nucleotide-gated potassium channel 2